MEGQRYLIVIADDFGIGPGTSQGILEMAAQRRVTGAVLLVNSPYAEEGVRAWRQSNVPLELGWHPCLTMDRPIAAPGAVRSLVTADGNFHSLGQFVRRLFLGRIEPGDLETELRAQEVRFRELIGHWPTFLNGHHHTHAFAPVSAALSAVLSRHRPLPYVRRVREPWSMLHRVPGARLKRAFLGTVGRRSARALGQAGFPGNDWLAGITDPRWVADPAYLARWLGAIPGRIVELACHPGHHDPTLVGRDCEANDGFLQRRIDEYRLLAHPDYARICRQAGFLLVSPSELARRGLSAAA